MHPKKVNEKFPELQVSWKELYLLHLGRIMTVQRSKSSFFLIASIHDYVFWNYWLLLFWNWACHPSQKRFQENQTHDIKKLQPKPGMQQQLQSGLAY